MLLVFYSNIYSFCMIMHKLNNKKYIVIYGTAKGKSQYIVYKRKAVKNIELAFKKQQDFKI